MTYMPPEGLAFTCDDHGNIQHIILDTTGFFTPGRDHGNLLEMTDPTSREKLEDFFQEVRDKGTALCLDLALLLGTRVEVMNFFGLARGVVVCTLSIRSFGNLIPLPDEMLGRTSEQAALSLALQQNSQIAVLNQPADTVALDEFMKINSELVNTQRDLQKSSYNLAQQEARFRKFIQESPDPNFILDEEERVLFMNQAAADLADRYGVHRFVLGQILPFPLGPAGEVALGQEQPQVYDMRRVYTTWEEKPASLMSLRDITARKKLEQLRSDVERMTRHDMKTPLNAIIGLPELLLMESNLTAEQEEMVQAIRQAGFQLLNMVNLSLELFKIETGTYILIPHPVNFTAVLEKISKASSLLARSKGLALDIRVRDIPLQGATQFLVNGEELLCYSMLANLIKNALEASPEKGTVRIDLDQDGEQTIIRIHNQGEVPKEIRGTFFDKYSSMGKKTGSGLGTYSARLMARVHKGDIILDTS